MQPQEVGRSSCPTLAPWVTGVEVGQACPQLHVRTSAMARFISTCPVIALTLVGCVEGLLLQDNLLKALMNSKQDLFLFTLVVLYFLH